MSENTVEELVQTAAVAVAALEDLLFGEASAERITPEEYGVAGQAEYVICEVLMERARQDEKWGPQHHTIAEWMTILGEEYGEACQAALDEIVFPKETA